jgi:hypothetical protein
MASSCLVARAKAPAPASEIATLMRAVPAARVMAGNGALSGVSVDGAVSAVARPTVRRERLHG